MSTLVSPITAARSAAAVTALGGSPPVKNTPCESAVPVTRRRMPLLPLFRVIAAVALASQTFHSLVLPVPAHASTGATLASPDGSPVVADVRLEQSLRWTELTTSLTDGVSVVALTDPSGKPLAAAFIDPTMDDYDDPGPIWAPQDVPSVFVNGIQDGYDSLIPSGDYRMYVAAQGDVEIHLPTVAPDDIGEAKPAPEIQVGINVVRPELLPMIDSTIELQKTDDTSTTVTMAVVAVQNHQASAVRVCLSDADSHPCTVATGGGTGMPIASPAGIGDGWVGVGYNAFRDFLDNGVVRARLVHTGIMNYHRATHVGIHFDQ